MFDVRRRSETGPLIIGHRGAMGYAPENTIASYELAIRQGVEMVECDVHLSKDGVPVVLHDHSLERTTNGTGLVREHTIDELKRLDAGSWKGAEFTGERLPTLDELLAWCSSRVALSIEVKNGPAFYEGIEERVVELVRKHGMLDRANVISFDHLAIKRIRELEPRLSAGVLFAARFVDAPAVARAADADVILPAYYFATRDVIEQAHAGGLAVSVWTVNDPDLARHLAEIGVDAIATNYPDRIKAALG
jgi:glycerophosphoryl diester phosphodiesterase